MTTARLLVTIISLLLVQIGSSTPCPLSGDAPTALTNGTNYLYINCRLPVNAFGDDLSNVAIVLVNATLGGIALRGSFAHNFTLLIIDSSFITNSPALYIDASSANFITLEIRRSKVIVSTPRTSMLFLHSVPLATFVYVTIDTSTISAADGTHLVYVDTAGGNLSHLSILISNSSLNLNGSAILALFDFDSVSHVTLIIAASSTLRAGNLLYADPPQAGSQVVKNISILLIASAATFASYLAAFWGNGLLVSGLNLVLLRTALSSHGSILYVRFAENLEVPSSFGNSSIHVQDSSIHTPATTFGIFGASGIVGNMSVILSNATVQCGQLLWIPIDAANGSAADISLFVSRSYVLIDSDNGDLFCVSGPFILQRISVGVFDSNVSTGFVLIGFSKSTSVSNIDIFFKNSTVHAAFAVFGLTDVVMVERMWIAAQSGTRASLSTSAKLTSVYCSIQNVSQVRASITLLIQDSSVSIIVTSPFLPYYPILFQLAALNWSTNGTIVATIRSSNVTIQQTAPSGYDGCAILSAILVDTAAGGESASALQLVIDDNSRISVSCATVASLVAVQQSPPVAFSIGVAGGTELAIATKLMKQRSRFNTIAGSFVLCLVNSAVSSAVLSISNSTIVCGPLCQVAGGSFPDDSYVYKQTLNTLLGYIPPSMIYPKVANVTLLLQKSSVYGVSTTAAMSLQLRPLFSLSNVSGARIILEGPMTLPSGLFDGIVGGGAATDGLRNHVELMNCETIHQVTPQSSGPGPKLVNFLMSEGERIGETTVVTRQSNGGTCMLTTTGSKTSTLSPSRTVTTLNTPSISAQRDGPIVEILPSTIASLRTASTAAMISCLPLAMFDPLAGAELQQAALVLLVAGCGSGVDGKPLPRAWSPLQLAVGDDGQTKYLVGAAIGNMVVLLGFMLLAAGLSLLVAVAKRDRGQSDQLRRKLFAAAERLNLPGWLMCPIMFLLQPTVACSVAAMASGTAAGITSGIVALAFLSFVLAGPVLLVTRYRGNLHSKPRPDATRSKLVAFFAGYRCWQLSGLEPLKQRHVGRVTMRYGPRTPWYFCVNLASSVAFGVCGSAQLAQHGCSLPVKVAVFVVLLASFAGKAVLRPYASHLRNGTNILSDGLCVVSVLLTLVLPGSVHVSETLALVAVYVVCGAQLGSMGVAAMAGRLGALSSCSSSRTGQLSSGHLSSTSQQQTALHALILMVCVKEATDRRLLGNGMERTRLHGPRAEIRKVKGSVHDPLNSFGDEYAFLSP